MNSKKVSTKLEENNINYQFKLLYAIGIVMIVANHTSGNGGISLFYELFPAASFEIGLFVFTSGYFYKEKYEENILKYFIKKLKTLILPLYAWNFVYALITQILHAADFTIGGNINFENLIIIPITNGPQFVYNLGSWFVAPLFMVEIFNVFLRRTLLIIRCRHKEVVYCVLTLVFGVAGVLLASKGYNTNGWLVLVRFLFFIPFYSIGFMYKKRLEQYDNCPNSIYFSLVLAIQLTIIFVCGYAPQYEPSWCNFPQFSILPYLTAFTGIAFWLRIARILTPVIGSSKLVNIIADSTYSIMVNHMLGFMLVKLFFSLCNRINYNIFADFDRALFKTDIWYFYRIKGLSQTLIIYVVVSIAICIVIKKAIDNIKRLLIKKFNGNENIVILLDIFVMIACLIVAQII